MKTKTVGTKEDRDIAVPVDAAASLVNRTTTDITQDTGAASRLVEAGSAGSVRQRRAELAEFYERYEDFVECLCDAAQAGPKPSLADAYDRARNQIIEQYPTIRPYVGAYYRRSRADLETVVEGISLDALELLIAPPNLEEFLKMDDGSTISRIDRTREALGLYAEHLRQLAQRVG